MTINAFPGSTRTRQELLTRLTQVDGELAHQQVAPSTSYVYQDSVVTAHSRFENLLPHYPGASLAEMRSEALGQAKAADHILDAPGHDAVSKKVFAGIGTASLLGSLIAVVGQDTLLVAAAGVAVASAGILALGCYLWYANRTEEHLLHQSGDGAFVADKLSRWGQVLEQPPVS